uniref:Uncharacterized protein n=1 Tax=Lygus hesperus TaxID=30085 RepID=A0A0K8TGJ6_LYGHE
MFLYEVLVVGVTADILMKSSDEEKIQIRGKVQSLIDNGAIKPLKAFTGVSPNALNVDVVETLRHSKSKVIVNFKDYNIRYTQTENSYVIRPKIVSSFVDNVSWICGWTWSDGF